MADIPVTTTTSAVFTSLPAGAVLFSTSTTISAAFSLLDEIVTADISSTVTNLPTSLPTSIEPSGGVPQAPIGSILIQLGWYRDLNYPFVAATPAAVQQFQDLVPGGITYALNISSSSVVLQYLQPYNTLATSGYITTLLMLYLPADQVTHLSLLILNPSSLLYHNPHVRTKELMSLLNSTIPLLAGATSPDGATSASSDIITEITTLDTSSTTARTPTSVNSAATLVASGTADTRGHDPTFPKWGIAILVVGLSLVFIGAGIFLCYRKKAIAYRRTSNTMVAQTRNQSLWETDCGMQNFTPREELPGSLGNMSAPLDITATAGALESKQELETKANRHELEAFYHIRNQ